jgi:thermitase
MKNKVWMLACALMVVLFSSTVLAAPTFEPRAELGKHVPGEILVGFKANSTADQINAAVKGVGGSVIGGISFTATKLRRVKLAPSSQEAMDQAISALKANALVKYAEPNIIRWIHGTRGSGGRGIDAQSGDPLLWAQWGYYDIGANWVSPYAGTNSPLVAVIDTGVDYTHPDLVGKVVKGYDFVNADADPMDDHGHGTHVSGVIAAATNNAYGIAGIAWKSKILAIKALSSAGWGSDYDIALALHYAGNNASVKVINMSLGGGYSDTEYDAVYYAVVTKKKLLVASAGNENTNVPSYPGGLADPVNFPEFEGRVLAVAAHDSTQCRASFSNYGSWVSVTAPGVDVLSTVPPATGSTGFASWSGTSMAAPHVTGAAAAAWERYPSFNNIQVANLITQNNAAAPGFELVRDDPDPLVACWPMDGSTFERLDLLHMLDASFFESGDKGGIFGFAFNAENGEPLAGAKVTAKQGTTVTGTDYVPYYGALTYYYPDAIATEGYGLFNVLTEAGTSSLTFTKTGFTPPVFTGVDVSPDSWTYLGNVPVPPNKPYYWLAVTWDYGYPDAYYDSYLWAEYDDTVYYYNNTGTLNAAPWVKLLWDSDNLDYNLRDYSEVFRISKLISGKEYYYWVADWWNGALSESWNYSGIKAYIFRWDAVNAKPKLFTTVTPPPGSMGAYWDICSIVGNSIVIINEVYDLAP